MIISLLFISTCFVQNDQVEKEIKQLIIETDSSNKSSVSNFIKNISAYGQKSIPFLLRSWKKTPDYSQLSLVCEAIYQIGDSSLYNNLYGIFNSTDNLKTKQTCAFLLFFLHSQEVMLSKNYGIPKPEILEIALFSMADTSLKFSNPDMAHLGMVSFAGFEIFTGDLIKGEDNVYNSFEKDDYKSLKNLLSKWYNKNKNNLIWDSQKRQFVYKQ
ncbi:MAG: hypothetical protein ACFFD1_07525 [Candidatus Thorarchaeota archaeon]